MSEAQGHRPFVGYRPICDTWILARPRVPYYGAYPNGFLERARVLLGAAVDEPVLHVCGGMARSYPGRRGFGPNDRTLDRDLLLFPDYGYGAERVPTRGPHDWDEDAIPNCRVCGTTKLEAVNRDAWECVTDANWRAILADPPYTSADAEHYKPGPRLLPHPNAVVKAMYDAVKPGRRVAMLHYVLPQPPKGAIFVACVGVVVGFNNRMRCFSVFEKPVEVKC